MRAPRSLQWRLTALVVALATVVWAVTAIMTWVDASHELDELLDSHLAQAAALLVARQAHDIEEAEGVDAPPLHRYAPKVAFQVFHAGRLALRSANAPLEPMLPRGPGTENGFQTVRIDGRSWRVFAAHGAEQDVQVYVGELTSSRAAILRAVLRGSFWPIALALPLLGIAVAWAVRRGLSPLRRLRTALLARDPQALDPLESRDAPAEIEPVIDALNALFGRIATLLESERRFTADAAHELRTPVAAIRANAQMAAGEAEPQERALALKRTLQACDRASHLIDQLLTLSRLESLGAQALGAVDLAGIARAAAAEVAPLALQKAQVLELDAAEPCAVRGDETLLGVLVRNLVDNAVRYSPHGAHVQVRVRRSARAVVLQVEDGGPGLDPRALGRLGERFFRADGTGQPGSGLGWSIVRRIGDVHHARVETETGATLGGLCVSVTLPASP